MNKVISVDPGRDKCGLLLVDLDEYIVLEGRVVSSESVIGVIESWLENSSISKIFLGNGTTSKYWEKLLKKYVAVQLVEESGSTLRARNRYKEIVPHCKLLKWIPYDLLFPPQNLDAVAALIMLEDYLNKKLTWSNSGDFKI